MDTLAALQQALDAHRPNWAYEFATQSELQEFAASIDNRRTSKLRRRVGERLLTPIIACVHAGLVTPIEGF